MKNQTLIITGVSLALVLVAVIVVSKKKSKTVSSSVPKEIDYESDEYKAYLQERINEAMDIKDHAVPQQPDIIGETIWEF